MKINRFQPQGNLNQFSVNDSIRWVINGKHYWDPYSAYIQFDIEYTGDDNETILQLDGSAQSLIRTLIIRSSGVELERIEEYDVLGNVLNDMNYSIEQVVFSFIFIFYRKRASVLNQGTGFMNNGFMADKGEQFKKQMVLCDNKIGVNVNNESIETRYGNGLLG